MTTLRPITRALISVSDKTGLEPLAQFLKKHSVEVLSTGGTAKALRAAGLSVKDISDHTGFPEIMDGRVKTLHPKVHGGLLACLDNPEHKQAMDIHQIEPIELVVVNLYPFEATIKRDAPFAECIENIDIGGPSMIRSAAKNHHYTTVITDPADYAELIQEMESQNGSTSYDFRTRMAAKAFACTASYDAAISSWFAQEQAEDFPETLVLSAERVQTLRYGENPHQNAAVYVKDREALSIANAEQLQGKELSYNNINDADAALELVSEFHDPAVAIIKHANPCGVAVGASLTDAYHKALASDPVSAFGGIIAVNRTLDGETAKAIGSLFLEVIVAPDADAEAREILAAKKNLRLLLTRQILNPHNESFLIKTITGGFLLQSRDTLSIHSSDLQIVTKRAPTTDELADLLFAFTVCKHVKSNAIVLARHQATIGIGAGQMSRVNSVHMATLKSAEGEGNKDRSRGAVIASDAFFPFADGLLLAAEAGITAAIQPGGSIRDDEVIKAADEHGIAMVFTGHRHFRH